MYSLQEILLYPTNLLVKCEGKREAFLGIRISKNTFGRVITSAHKEKVDRNQDLWSCVLGLDTIL